jgi:hypothetical protein
MCISSSTSLNWIALRAIPLLRCIPVSISFLTDSAILVMKGGVQAYRMAAGQKGGHFVTVFDDDI